MLSVTPSDFTFPKTPPQVIFFFFYQSGTKLRDLFVYVCVNVLFIGSVQTRTCKELVGKPESFFFLKGNSNK